MTSISAAPRRHAGTLTALALTALLAACASGPPAG